MANDSLFHEVISKGDLGNAAQLANSVLQIVRLETKVNFQDEIKVNAFTNAFILLGRTIRVVA